MKKLILALSLCFSSLAYASDAGTEAVAVESAEVAAQPIGAEVATDSTVTAPVPDVEKDPVGVIQQIHEAGKSKNYRILVILVIGVAVYGIRLVAKKGWVKWFATDRGGAALALGVGILEAVVVTVGSGGSFTIWMIVDGVVNGVTAAGGVQVIKRLTNPKDIA